MKQEVLFTCEGVKDVEIVLQTWIGENNGCLETEQHLSYLVSTSNHNGYCYRFYEEGIEGM
jgi:hypothetical protein